MCANTATSTLKSGLISKYVVFYFVELSPPCFIFFTEHIMSVTIWFCCMSTLADATAKEHKSFLRKSHTTRVYRVQQRNEGDAKNESYGYL